MRDMTEGSIPGHMMRFTVPLLLSNVFQQLYNAADTVIVGRYLGKEALAAVGSAGAVMNILFFLIFGISMGASVIIAQYYGARRIALVKKEMGTACTAGMLFTVFIIILSFSSADWVQRTIKTPDEILPQAVQYLRIIIGGLIFTFIYNMLSSAMRALGDANAPVIFLILSSGLNIILDLIFIRSFGMGTSGAAWATVISQAAAAILCVIHIRRKVPALRLAGQDFTVDPRLLRQTIRFSGVYAVQQCVLYSGVLLVQGTVNSLGIDAMAAYNAGTKIDNFFLMPGDSLAAALSTFAAQNTGAGNTKRIKAGLGYTIGIGLGFCGILALLLLLTAPRMMGLFLDSSDSAVILLGTSYLRMMAVLYPLTALCNSFQGFFRGIGNMKVTLIATLLQIPIRVVLSAILVHRFALNAVPVAAGIGWIAMILYEFYEYNRYRKSISSGNPADKTAERSLA
ncbi:MATE family efflux transporter [Breznakiella homolactica]|uniref:Multidrug-efflux transporter n=2 Tax=Breznakiella homolactica TaxID=2798577 RepID=A0A7T7XNL7_9SPIR|nr:MATE family efflux transporter [Breznakiella homolactica]